MQRGKMCKNIIRKTNFTFWFTLSMGICFLWIPFGELGKGAFAYSIYIVIGTLTGLILGWCVYFCERTMYIKHRQKSVNSPYETTFLANFIFYLLTFLIIISNNKWEISYTVALPMAEGWYLLMLSVILYIIRFNKQIIVK